MKIASNFAWGLVFLGVVIFVLRSIGGEAKGQTQNFCINLFVPLNENKEFQPKDLMSAFGQIWETNIECHILSEKETENSAKKFIVSAGSDKNVLHLTWIREPLKKEMIDLLVMASEKGMVNNEAISAGDVTNLKNHKSFFQIEYILGSSTPKERVLFTSELLLTLTKLYPAAGFVNASAQSYIPSTKIRNDFLKNKETLISDLFLLFVNIQLVSDEQRFDLHTHGMDQFWLPDIQMIFTGKNNLGSNFDVIRNAAVYMIENGKPMNIGDSAELAGNGKLFKVIEVKENNDHPFGYFGVFGLDRQE